jgi:hypothetical protein
MAAVAHVAAAAFRIHQAMEVEMVRMTLAVTAFALAVASPAAYAADAAQMEANKKTVAALYDAVLNQKDFEKASQYLGRATPSTIPMPPTGRKGSKASSAS